MDIPQTGGKGGSKKAKAKGRKINRNLKKCASYKSERRRERAKERRVLKDEILKSRPDSQVSANCLKKRQERRRNNSDRKRFEAISRGEIQFGEGAKGHHLHQRLHGLATALTPAEFQRWEEKRRTAANPKVVLTSAE